MVTVKISRGSGLPAPDSLGRSIARAVGFSTAFWLACLANLAFFSSLHLMLPVLPLYLVHLGADESVVGLSVGAFTVAAVLMRPMTGWATDQWGRKRLMLLGAAIFTVAAFSYPWLQSVALVLALRLLHGGGIACFTTGGSTYATDVAPQQRRGEALGIYGLFSNLAMAFGPALGGLVHQARGFKVLFYLCAASAAAAVGFCLGLPEVTAGRRRSSRLTLVNPSAILPAAIYFTYAFSYGCLVTLLPLYCARLQVINPGLLFSTFAVTVALSRIPGGKLSDRAGRLAVIVPGALLVGAAMLLFGRARTPLHFLLAAGLYGAGAGGVYPGTMALTADRATGSQRGSAFGTLFAAFDLGIGAGAVTLGALAARTGSYPLAFITAAVVSLLGAGAALGHAHWNRKRASNVKAHGVGPSS